MLSVYEVWTCVLPHATVRKEERYQPVLQHVYAGAVVRALARLSSAEERERRGAAGWARLGLVSAVHV